MHVLIVSLVEDDTFLPCEFCLELFPFENLIGHQVSPKLLLGNPCDLT